MSNLCRGCDQTFYSVGAFDMHRAGDYGKPIYQASPTGKSEKIIGHEKLTRRCLSVEEMIMKGMKQEKHDMWTTGKDMSFRMRPGEARLEI